ncbi:MAG: MBOAT family protein [Leptospiraceae bacterium]|nr:MBOAT family protein [Leptospiraceae bacterium]
MLFHTAVFGYFFGLLTVIYYLARGAWRPWILLLASILFYSWWSPLFTLHFLAVIAINYFYYRLRFSIYTAKGLAFIVALNLLNLFLFKYFYFIADSLQLVAQWQSSPQQPWSNVLRQAGYAIVLPLAISFYTFQIIALHVDHYRGRASKLISARDYFLFILFFPQLIAGPIMRYHEFGPQLRRLRSIPPAVQMMALQLFLSGLVKKSLVADPLATWIQPVFERPGEWRSLSLWLAMYAFAIQIYADFSGYVDMARGAALALGFQLPENFRSPYFASSLREFWQRWHITLSEWLRDYLYIPLGGNRHGYARELTALFITMLLGGLWHGASFTFLIWGALHGVYLILERLGNRLRSSMGWARSAGTITKLMRIMLVFHLVCLAWIFFRSANLDSAASFVGGLVSTNGNQSLPQQASVLLAVFLFVFLHSIQSVSFPIRLKTLGSRWSLALRITTACLVILYIAGLQTNPGNIFIYFEF